MSTRRQTVRSYQPQQFERFDQQFWPVFMAMCITATILAATVVTLLSGLWMWVSLMVLPAAVSILLLVLRFVDDRRIRRSAQLALILSLAAHCAFLIFAHQTEIFHGVFLEVNRMTTAVRQPRVIHTSKQLDVRPWMQLNEVPSPSPLEPQPEKQHRIDTATARPQPTPVQNQNASDSPQLVRRQQLSQTVPRLGRSLSQMSRQTENMQPRSSEQVAMAAAAPRSESSDPSELTASENEVRRSTPASSVEAPRTADRSDSPAQPTRESALARNESARPATPQPTAAARTPRRETTSQPVVAEASPRRNVQAPPAAMPPESRRTASMSSAAAELQRRSPTASQPVETPVFRRDASSSPTVQMAQRNPRRDQPRPVVPSATAAAQPSRSTVNAPSPTTPENTERPRPVNRTALRQGSAEMNPQPMALEKSSGGTAGVGRSVNLDRDAGSQQSAATTASDSQRRRESTTQRPRENALAVRQMARTPRSTAAEMMPSSAYRPDSIPVANRAATEQPAELTASASASLSQSNSDARRSNVSVERGTGNVDVGPTKIVSEIPGRRVEGGGQPEIQSQPTSQQMTQRGDRGASSPALASDDIAPATADPGNRPAEQMAAWEPAAAAEADLLSRRGGQSASSGGPANDDIARDEPVTANASDLADSTLGRADQQSDDEEDDEEARRRKGELAQQVSRSRRSSGSEQPAVDVDAPLVARNGTAGQSSDRTAEMTAQGGDLNTRTASRTGVTGQRGEAGESSIAASGPAGDSNSRRSDNAQPDARQGTAQAAPSRSTTSDQPLMAAGDTPELQGQRAVATGQSNQMQDDPNVAQLDRSTPPGMSLDIDARIGPAGISNELEPDPGIDSRRASRDSPAVQSMTETRFRRNETGGSPSISTAPVIAREAFRSRNNPSRSSSAPQTEEAIELGLAFLARHQQDDGSWTLGGFDVGQNDVAVQLSSDTAATGLAILAFQGAGYNHREFKYASQLQAAIDWLIQHQQPSGELYLPADEQSNKFCRLYSHGIATLALTEAYGMTQDESLLPALRLALDFIADSQHPQLGGWRYLPRQYARSIGQAQHADTSVTGWMMMALQSARLAGLETDDKVWIGIERWADNAQDLNERHLFRYRPEARDTDTTRHGRVPSPCMTAVGLLMRLYMGWDRIDPRLVDGSEYLLEHLPDDSSINTRDTYYWYYATQIVRHVGGEAWETWHAALHPLLVGTQIKEGEMAGSWDPLNPVPDRWGAQAGRLYVTTMNLLSLEVDYRLLPLYDETAR